MSKNYLKNLLKKHKNIDSDIIIAVGNYKQIGEK